MRGGKSTITIIKANESHKRKQNSRPNWLSFSQIDLTDTPKPIFIQENLKMKTSSVNFEAGTFFQQIRSVALEKLNIDD